MMTHGPDVDGGGPARRRKGFWRIAWDSGLVGVLAGMAVCALLACAFLPGAPAAMKAWAVPNWHGSIAAVGSVLLLCLVPLFWLVRRNTVRRWRLARRGVPVEATVTRAEVLATPPPPPGPRKGLLKPLPHLVFVHYRFRDARGCDHDGRGRARELWPRPKPGDPIAVLYDPRRPENSAPEADLTV
jgi:hypothetical protein